MRVSSLMSATALSAIMLSTAPAFAQQADGEAAAEKDWFFAAGGAILARSTYEGSADVEITPIPYLEVEYKQKYFINGGQGIGAYLYRDNQTRLWTSIGFGFGREEEDDIERLAGIGDIDRGASLKVGGRLPLGKYLVGNAVVTHQVTGSDTGTTLDLGVGTRLPLSGRLSVFPALKATFADGEHVETVFGLNETQVAGSINAGGIFTETYEPEAGLKSVGAQVLLRYEINDRWEATGLASWNAYQGDVADSPIVEEDSNFFSIWGVAYRF